MMFMAISLESAGHIKLFGLAAILAPMAALAQEPVSIEPIAARYLAAKTYCETGKWAMRYEHAQSISPPIAFTGCAHEDGRFKHVEHADRPQKIINWADGTTFHRYSEYGRHYSDYPLDEPSVSMWGYRRETVPALHSRLFTWDSARGKDMVGSLSSYRLSPALSTPEHWVFERPGADGKTSERLRVSVRDRAIVRFEALRGGEVMRYVEITSQKIDAQLGDADLSHEVPFLARYSLQNNPAVFIAALFAAAITAGVLFWGWLFVRASDLEEVLRKRRRLWKVLAWTLSVTVALLAVLALITSLGRDTGHPPAIVFVVILAIWCGIGFALAACFILASYPTRFLFRGAGRSLSG
jgi:hypothetical protein